mmetsp:Transcript_8315/g.15853  ORF Transcript_8315/g.15853 Transcript_8315/m.15853 type:complete len:98 (+) Transcript_8315:88-381(+)|eukprot:scaffold5772_cov188-Amphora_coffeaeformis.AAC.8
MKFSSILVLLISVTASTASEDRHLRPKKPKKPAGGSGLPKPGQACRNIKDCAGMTAKLQVLWADVTSGYDLETKCCSMNDQGMCVGYDPEYGCYAKK